MTRRDLQQLVDAVAGGVVFITRQLQAYAGDFDRYQVVAGELCRALQMLVGAGFIATLLGGFCRQQVVHNGLLSVIGIFRHQLLNLLIIALRQLQQRLLGLLTRAATLAAHEPAAGMCAGAENAPQQPLNGKQHYHGEDHDDR